MNQSIAVGLDGSAESAAAAHWAAREAILRERPLLLVHCEEGPSPVGFRVGETEARERWAEALLVDASDALRGAHPHLRVSTMAVDGPPDVALTEVAPTSEMLVLGSRGLGTVSGHVLGSVGLAVLRGSERPVVLVRGTEEAERETRGHGAYGPVVVGIDTDRPSDALLAFAFEEAAQRACPLCVLHSAATPPLYGSGMAYEPAVTEQLTRKVEAKLNDLMAPWQQRWPTVGVDVRATIGRAADQILESGAGAGLVVVGRRIRRSSVGAHIGPVTHNVLRHASSPVAVVAHH
ncbi:universal stress protein [Streptomyces sp. NPDC005752]|uniref:universal stress protein n=1 Tax=Streptomyces sp. NPDC005752 TaxID=3157065 RepID=UPI0033ED336E